MSDLLNRRQFLFYGSATLAGLTLGQLGRRQLARADERAALWRGPGKEAWATSVCGECPAACGVRVRLIDDVPVKLEGNPLCPVGRGRLCARGQAGLESYFDPDRLVGPARRAGARGEDRWERITWDEAIATLASRLRGARRGEVLALAAEEHGPLAGAWTRFWSSAGARVAWAAMPGARALRAPLQRLTGASGEPVFDLERASYVVSFGAAVVEDWLSPVWTQRSYGRFRRGPGRARGRLVQIEGRHSLTAGKADEWIAVEPQHYAAIGYAIAGVLLKEGRANAAFLQSVGGHVDALEAALGSTHSPDTVAARTGVPVVTLLRLARELASSAQSLVVVDPDASPDLADAAFTLNALLGALDRPGGVFTVGGGGGAAADAPFEDAADALRTIAGGRAVPRVIALHDAAALRARDVPLDVRAALARSELVVSFSPYADEAAEVADLLLPTHTWLERWHAVSPAPADTAEKVALARPAVPPRLETRDLGEVLRAAADRLGGKAAAGATWRSSEDLVGAEIDRLWRLRRGGPYADRFQTEWLQQLETGGWWLPAADSRDRFGAALLEAGGWLDPFFAPGQLREALAAQGGPRFPIPHPVTDGGVPVDEAESASPAAYPWRLHLFTPAVVNLSGSPNQPALFELLGQPDGVPWRAWVEVAPDTAREHAIEHGSLVRVESAAGALDAVAIHAEGMPAGVAALSYVPAVARGGRWARLLDADGRRLWGHAPARDVCRVRLRAL